MKLTILNLFIYPPIKFILWIMELTAKTGFFITIF